MECHVSWLVVPVGVPSVPLDLEAREFTDAPDSCHLLKPYLKAI